MFQRILAIFLRAHLPQNAVSAKSTLESEHSFSKSTTKNVSVVEAWILAGHRTKKESWTFVCI